MGSGHRDPLAFSLVLFVRSFVRSLVCSFGEPEIDFSNVVIIATDARNENPLGKVVTKLEVASLPVAGHRSYNKSYMSG